MPIIVKAWVISSGKISTAGAAPTCPPHAAMYCTAADKAEIDTHIVNDCKCSAYIVRQLSARRHIHRQFFCRAVRGRNSAFVLVSIVKKRLSLPRSLYDNPLKHSSTFYRANAVRIA
jgi:hypothetical protein